MNALPRELWKGFFDAAKAWKSGQSTEALSIKLDSLKP